MDSFNKRGSPKSFFFLKIHHYKTTHLANDLSLLGKMGENMFKIRDRSFEFLFFFKREKKQKLFYYTFFIFIFLLILKL